MQRGVRFVDVLESALGAIAREVPASNDPLRVRTAPPRHAVHTPLYNLHTVTPGPGGVGPVIAAIPAAGQTGHASAWSRCEGSAKEADQKQPASHAVRPPVAKIVRPGRRLTGAQLRSLDTFNRLGIGVRADFSASELRSAFRTLARNCHPDRHPGASEQDRQRLAQQFTIIRNSYETLLAALDSGTV